MRTVYARAGQAQGRLDERNNGGFLRTMPEFDPTSPDAKMRAVNDKLVVKQFTPKQKGSIIMPGTDPLKHNTGQVLSVGPKCECGAKPGDYILWQVFKGQAVGHFDKERWIVLDEDVCTIIERPLP